MEYDHRKRQLNTWGRYSGIATQMLVIILVGVFGGYKLDGLFHTRPILVVVFSILSVALAIYSVTRDLLRKK